MNARQRTAAFMCLAVPVLLAADGKPPAGVPANLILSGPQPGTELTIFKADRVTSNTCVHCVLT